MAGYVTDQQHDLQWQLRIKNSNLCTPEYNLYLSVLCQNNHVIPNNHLYKLFYKDCVLRMDSKLSATMPHYRLPPNFLGDCWDRNQSIEGKKLKDQLSGHQQHYSWSWMSSFHFTGQQNWKLLEMPCGIGIGALVIAGRPSQLVVIKITPHKKQSSSWIELICAIS